MSWVTIKYSEPVAKKEHSCSSEDALDGYGIVRRNADGTWRLDEKQVEDYQITAEDAKYILDFANNGFKIMPGEKHRYYVGTFDGEFMTTRWNFEMYDIVFRYDLYDEN